MSNNFDNDACDVEAGLATVWEKVCRKPDVDLYVAEFERLVIECGPCSVRWRQEIRSREFEAVHKIIFDLIRCELPADTAVNQEAKFDLIFSTFFGLVYANYKIDCPLSPLLAARAILKSVDVESRHGTL